MEAVNIGVVERETGVPRDVLRVWERRYQFPMPARDPRGDRLYTRSQIETLRLIKRLVDRGHRPRAVVGRPRATLLTMLKEASAPERGAQKPETVATYLKLVQGGRFTQLHRLLEKQLEELELLDFLEDVLSPLNRAIGNAWASGQLPIYNEHLYSETVKGMLSQLIASMPRTRRRPRVLLTTLPNEQHGLGLVMVNTLFRSLAFETVFLGNQTPSDDIVEAARYHRVDAVGLSFSSAFPRQVLERDVARLRHSLPSSIELWLGGDGAQKLREEIRGTRSARTLKEAVDLVNARREFPSEG